MPAGIERDLQRLPLLGGEEAGVLVGKYTP